MIKNRVKKTIATGLGAAALIGGGLALAAPSQAQGCASGYAAGNGGGYCDFDYAPDGSYTHCETVYVMGFGGTNCYRVYPGAR
jgi:hypothetical protein